MSHTELCPENTVDHKSQLNPFTKEYVQGL
jgi:hypothetical protein